MKNNLLVMPAARQDDKPLVEVNWKREDMKGKPLSSIYLLDHSSSTQADYLEVLKRNPNLISQFVAKLSKTFHARLLSIHKDPPTLVLCHRSADDFRYLTENRQALIELIRELIPYQGNAGRLELKVSFHGGETKSTPDLQNNRLMDIDTHDRNQTFSKLELDKNDTALDDHFAGVSVKLSKQRENFDLRLQRQNEKLEIVKNEINKIGQYMQRQLNEKQNGTGGERTTSSLDQSLSTREQTSSLEERLSPLDKLSSSQGRQLRTRKEKATRTSSEDYSLLIEQTSSNGTHSSSPEKQSSSHQLSPNSEEQVQGEEQSGSTDDRSSNDVAASTNLERVRDEDDLSRNGYSDTREDSGKTRPQQHEAMDKQFKPVKQEHLCNEDESEDENDSDDDNDDSDDNDEEEEEVIDELKKAIEDLKQRRARGEDTCSTTPTPDPYSFRSNSGLLTSPSQLEHVLLRLGMEVTKETHPKLEVEHAAICTLKYLREFSLLNVSDKIWRMADIAIENEPTPVPRSETSFDTILCLDNFGTMSRGNLSRLKEIALDFINGIEDIADEYGLEENIAVVALGSSPQILHHLSIDYDSIRETIEDITCGGYTAVPYLEGVLMSLAALTRGGVCDLGGYLRVPPRLILITDGVNLSKTEMCKTKADQIKTFKAFVELGTPFVLNNVIGEVIVVPNGQVDEDCISTPISKCKGRLVNNIASLCNNQRVKRHAAQILKYIDSQCGLNRSTATNIDEILHAFTAGFKSKEKTDISNLVKKKDEVLDRISVYSFTNMHEESNLPPLGSRVIRGPDWPWNDTDGNGPGTVVNHEPDRGNVWVFWDNNNTLHKHCYGYSGYIDVCPVDDQPLLPQDSDHLTIRIGMQVERGPDWHESYGDQDGGPGSFGTVIRYGYGRVMVRWSNGEMHEYRFGENERYDLTIRSSYDKVKDKEKGKKKDANAGETRSEYPVVDTTQGRQQAPSGTMAPQYTPTRWYWQDPDGSWIPYSHGENEKLIKTYTRRPDGSCLIQRDGQNFRVLFKALKEKSIDKPKGDSRNVRFE